MAPTRCLVSIYDIPETTSLPVSTLSIHLFSGYVILVVNIDFKTVTIHNSSQRRLRLSVSFTCKLS